MTDFYYDVSYFIIRDNEQTSKVVYNEFPTYLQAVKFYREKYDYLQKKIDEKTLWFIELAEHENEKFDAQTNEVMQIHSRIKKKEGNI